MKTKQKNHRGLRILSEQLPAELKELPDGSLNARWVYSRGVYQVYLGNRVLIGVNGETDEECTRALNSRYMTSRTITFH